MISMQRIIEEVEPDVIGLTETKMDEEEPLDFKDEYSIYRNDRNKDGGGVLIAVKKIYKHLVYDIRKYNSSEESIWVDLDGKKKYRIGNIYMPDENKTSVTELKKIYSRIRKEIKGAKVEDRIIILMGDFNCKLGNVASTEETLSEANPAPEKSDNSSKGGKVMKDMLIEEQLETVNNMELCTGCEWTWTRTVLGEVKKSTLDYIIVEKDNSSSVSEANIDEGKEITPYHGTTHKTYTDHRAITITINTSVLETTDNRKNDDDDE